MKYIDTLTPYQICRWSALYDAINLIADKCEERNIPAIEKYFNAISIQQYVDSATDEIYHKYFGQIKNS